VIEQACSPKDSDTFLALLGYYILGTGARCHAKTWWEGNYVSVLFPNARLDSPRISEFLKRLGDEKLQRRFLNTISGWWYQVPGYMGY